MISGHATQEGTSAYAQASHPFSLRFRTLGKTGWTVSPLGFGSYRVDADVDEHEEALDHALESGCNLIDTSTNYADGGSEILIGRRLGKLIEEGKIRREQVVVVSKVGYVQGANLELARRREAEGKAMPDMVKFMDGCWHSLHPDFIREQLALSRGRLQLECIDVYLLHNPEYFFSDALQRKDQTPLETLRDTFYDRIRRAFAELEAQAEAGKIQYYGVSSNTFGGDARDPEMTSVGRMLEIARELAREKTGDPERHRFRVVQLPANLFESGPVLRANTGEENAETALSLAAKNGLAVLVNRPLNAVAGDRMVRLSDFELPKESEPITAQLMVVSKLEDEFANGIARHITTEEGSVPSKEFFRWAAHLANLEKHPIGIEQWGQMEMQARYGVTYLMVQLDKHLGGALADEWSDWSTRYRPEFDRLMRQFRDECARRSQKISEGIASRIAEFLPESLRKESLSRKAIAVMLNVPGVTVVLNGMRKKAYVDDALGAGAMAPFEVSPKIWDAFR